jgi:tRNA(Ile2) C34 agmatinyltransferase TiaS
MTNPKCPYCNQRLQSNYYGTKTLECMRCHKSFENPKYKKQKRLYNFKEIMDDVRVK